MEKPPSFENRELVIDRLINGLAKREGMSPDDILSDIITFAPHEQNDAANPDYINQVAEMIGISSEEMSAYAIRKAKDSLNEQEKPKIEKSENPDKKI